MHGCTATRWVIPYFPLDTLKPWRYLLFAQSVCAKIVRKEDAIAYESAHSGEGSSSLGLPKRI
jgi:hypothetical protein